MIDIFNIKIVNKSFNYSNYVLRVLVVNFFIAKILKLWTLHNQAQASFGLNWFSLSI